MKIAFAAVFGFQVLCSVGFTAPLSTMKFTDESVTGDDTSTNESIENNSYSYHADVNVDLTESKINESEIFEHGQTAKEDRQRSFIYIQNTKSRLPWKTKTRGSFFLDDFTNAKEVFNDGDNNLNGCRPGYQINSNRFYKEEFTPNYIRKNNDFTQTNTRNRGNYDSMNYVFPTKLNGKIRISAKNRPNVLSNERTLPPPTPVTIKSYYRKSFKYPVKAQKNMYSQKESATMFNKSVNIPQQIGRHYKMPYVVAVSPTRAPTGFNSPVESKTYLPHISEQDNIQKLNTFINDIASRDHSANEKQFNCFNRECGNSARNYRVNMNNGILRGSKCVCQKSISARQNWRPRKIPVTASEKAAIRALNANESDDSYETLIKETKKLSKIVEGME